MPEQKVLPMSLVVIAKNEAQTIQACLESVPFVAEKLVVVDTQTQDETAEVAEQAGARVIKKEWMGFGPQKKWAVQQAQHDWVLCLDADERLSEEAQQEILAKFAQLDPRTLYYFPRVSWFLGGWIWHGGWFPDFQGRLFHRQFSQWNDALIHERVIGVGDFAHFLGPIEHEVFEHLEDQVQTNLRYSRLLSEADERAGKLFFAGQLVLRPLGKFIETYFLKQGFRDGWPGFIIAVNASYSLFLRYAFRWEKKNVQLAQKDDQRSRPHKTQQEKTQDGETNLKAKL